MVTGLSTGLAAPVLVLGVEQEYKWRIDARDLFGTDRPDLDDLARVLPAPDTSQEELRFQHTQSSIYFDDNWHLTRDRVTLRATVNPGRAKDVSWLGIKQTIRWEDGCRDSLEVNERVAPGSISQEIRDRRALPLTYACRLAGRPIVPSAYACVVQHRHKLFYRDQNQMLLQLTFDISEFRVLPDGERALTTWLEVENNTADLRARDALTAWANEITDRLGHQPTGMAKSEIAARMAGWTGPR
jgi:hypothetical protein